MPINWYRIDEREDRLRPLSFIIGGRGIGKTYSTIDYVVNKQEPFLYLRNTQVQLTESQTNFGNPFKAWNKDHGRNLQIIAEGQHSVIKETGEGSKKKSPVLGYAAALSTFENLRGVDLSDVSYVIYDEFVERRTLSYNQFDTFANFYETVNRNRELVGKPALQVFLLSNSQMLNNGILAGYGCIPIIEQMIKAGEEEYIARDMYINLPKSDVSEAKRDTVNYRLTRGSQYYQEALENSFAYDSFANIRKRPLVEYVPIVQLDDIFIWQHKSNGRYYVCRSASNKVPVYSSRDSFAAFIRRYGLTLRMADLEGKVDYSEFLMKTKLSSIFT